MNDRILSYSPKHSENTKNLWTKKKNHRLGDPGESNTFSRKLKKENGARSRGTYRRLNRGPESNTYQIKFKTKTSQKGKNNSSQRGK